MSHTTHQLSHISYQLSHTNCLASSPLYGLFSHQQVGLLVDIGNKIQVNVPKLSVGWEVGLYSGSLATRESVVSDAWWGEMVLWMIGTLNIAVVAITCVGPLTMHGGKITHWTIRKPGLPLLFSLFLQEHLNVVSQSLLRTNSAAINNYSYKLLLLYTKFK